jgi:hypothetical protein
MFWKRFRDLSDWEKVIKNIERGEQKIQRQQDIMNAVAAKLERYKNPWQELKVRERERARAAKVWRPWHAISRARACRTWQSFYGRFE